MIHRFRVKNFFSFRDSTEVSMIANELVPEHPSLCNSCDNRRVSTLLAVIGHNASGKTSLLKALSFMSWFIQHSFSEDPESLILIEPHAATSNEPSEFEIEFNVGDTLYSYELTITKKRVLYERLRKKVTRYRYIFERSWDEKSKSYDISQQFNFGLPKTATIRENASLISIALQHNSEMARHLLDAAGWIFSNVSLVGKIGQVDEIEHAASLYHASAVHKKKAITLFNRLDFGIDDMHIEEKNSVDPTSGEERKTLHPVFHHISGTTKFNLPLYYESNGTKGAFAIFPYILLALERGGVAVLDEMEAELHPYMVLEIIRMFSDTKINKHCAQLIMATHSLEILSKVEKNQLYLVEKNDCVSTAWRLDEIKDIRRGENIYARYMAGSYGAVPYIQYE